MVRDLEEKKKLSGVNVELLEISPRRRRVKKKNFTSLYREESPQSRASQTRWVWQTKSEFR